MDPSVLNALERWPDVPAVYGWLSLSARGDWRLHPLGDANQGGPGTGITNTQILGFIGRNYDREPDGAWYFQNGPQRVYVRLDAAPFVLHVMPSTGALITHNNLTVQRIDAWFADDAGQLYAQTELGAGRIDDRDLQILAEVLVTADGQSLIEVLDNLTPLTPHAAIRVFDLQARYAALQSPASLQVVACADIPARMGFIARPHKQELATTSVVSPPAERAHD